VIIRFPTSARWDHPVKPSASWLKRIWWRLFAHRRRVNVAKLRIDRARRYG
jgi:hypothetical protein